MSPQGLLRYVRMVLPLEQGLRQLKAALNRFIFPSQNGTSNRIRIKTRILLFILLCSILCQNGTSNRIRIKTLVRFLLGFWTFSQNGTSTRTRIKTGSLIGSVT